MGFLCLYIFNIAGSLMPDTLWVLNGYPRGASIINRTTPAGIYHLFFGSWQGLLVYGPLYVLVLPGLWALRKKSLSAFVLVLLVCGPYLLIAASHDLGGARGWIPASRYMVVLIPVFAIAMAAWLGNKRLRWMILVVAAAASFWIAQGMLDEPNFVYDRSAFLASRHVNVSPLLGTVLEPQSPVRRVAYPALLLIAMVLFVLGERGKWLRSGSRSTVLLIVLVLAAGGLATIGSEPEEWIDPRGGNGPVRLRPGRSEVLLTADCEKGDTRLRFEGAGGPHGVSVRGLGLERHLDAYATGLTEVDIHVEPIVRITRGERRTTGWVELRLEEGQTPLLVRTGCP
jgi:hypothetical protein